MNLKIMLNLSMSLLFVLSIKAEDFRISQINKARPVQFSPSSQPAFDFEKENWPTSKALSTQMSLTTNYYDDDIHFNTEEFIVNCKRKTASEVKLSGFMNDFLAKSCKNEDSLSNTFSYCACISKLTNGKQIKKDNIDALMEEAFKAKFLKKLNDAIFLSLNNSDLVGYAEISDKKIRNELKAQSSLYGDAKSYESCSPGQIHKVVSNIRSSRKKNSRCQQIFDSPENVNYSKKYIDQLKSSTKGFSNYFTNGKSESFGDFIETIDEISSFRLEKGLIISDSKLLKNYSIYTDEMKYDEDHIVILQNLHKDQIAFLMSLEQNHGVLTIDQYKKVYDIYRTNPYLRMLAGDKKLHSPNLMGFSSSDAKVFANTILKQIDIKPPVLRKGDGLDQMMENFNEKIKRAALLENNECLGRFVEIEKMCNTSPQDLFGEIDASELSDLIDDVFEVKTGKTEFADYEKKHVTAGLAFCHSKQCANDNCNASEVASSVQTSTSLGKITRVGEVIGNAVSSGVGVGGSGSGVISEAAIEVTDGHSNQRNERSPSSSGESLNSNESLERIGSDFTDADSGVTPNYDIAVSNQASTFNPSQSATMDYLGPQNSQRIVDDKSTASAGTSASSADGYYENLKKQLEEIQTDLNTSRIEQSKTKKELDDYKKKAELDKKEAELTQKEQKLQSTISSLEEKINTLEAKEQAVGDEMRRPRSSESSFVSSAPKKFNKIEEAVNSAPTETATKASNAQVAIASGTLGTSVSSASGISAFESGRRLTLQASNKNLSVGNSTIHSVESFDDQEKLQSLILKQGNGMPILVNVDGQIYRVSQSINENGQTIITREIASIEEVEVVTVKEDVEVARLPASIEEDFVGPILQQSENKFRLPDLMELIRNGL